MTFFLHNWHTFIYTKKTQNKIRNFHQCFFAICLFLTTSPIYAKNDIEDPEEITHTILQDEKSQNSQQHTTTPTTNTASETITHDFTQNTHASFNPLFLNEKQEISLYYTNLLGLSNTQTLIFHGVLLEHQYPILKENLQIKILNTVNLGNALLTAQNTQNSSFYYSFMSSFHGSTQLPPKNVIVHMVFGADAGISSINKQSFNVMARAYLGFDFIYQDFIFRPFVGTTILMPFDNPAMQLYSSLDLGFSTFYKLNNILVVGSIAVLGSFMQNNTGIFTIIPNAKALLLQRTSSHLSFETGIKYTAIKNFSVRANVFMHYTMSFYNINIGANIGATYHF